MQLQDDGYSTRDNHDLARQVWDVVDAEMRNDWEELREKMQHCGLPMSQELRSVIEGRSRRPRDRLQSFGHPGQVLYLAGHEGIMFTIVTAFNE